MRRGFHTMSGGCVAVVVVGALTAPAVAAPPGSTTFLCTGGEQTYSVKGAKSLIVTAVGAPGGTIAGIGKGGFGARITSTVSLPKGTRRVYVEVGCGGDVGTGGFNGGGSSLGPRQVPTSGGGGGGASDVRLQPLTTSLLTSDTRFIVAGGGGGAGYCWTTGSLTDAGGSGGDAAVTGAGAGGSGTSNPDCSGTAGAPGGTGAPGGLGSAAGSLGQGGDTPDHSLIHHDLGGGGGGGYYGGGAGVNNDLAFAVGGAGGGGGGSSFWISGATSTSMSTDTTGIPKVVITRVK